MIRMKRLQRLDPSEGQKYTALQSEIVLLIDKPFPCFVGDPEGSMGL